MSVEQTSSTLTVADREKRRVALSSLGAAMLLTVLKLIVGLATNSLGILAEAVHSALDLVAAGITYWAVRISGRPADHEHTYGHGKFENLSALVETLLLLGTCVWIFFEAGSRLCFGAHERVIASPAAFAVILLSIAVDYSRSKALKRTAEKYESQALEADALHFSTDIWSSCVVLLGLFAVLISNRFNVVGLEMADAVAALAVALIVVHVSLKLGKKSVADLLDSIPPGLHVEVTAAAAEVPGVEEVCRLRLRRSGPEVFADLTLSVNHSVPFERTHQIADAAESAVREVIPGADVVVHVEPVARDDEGLLETVRVLAARHGLGAHGIRIYEEHEGRSIELHLEVGETLDLEEAHAQATDFERELRIEAEDLERIVSHLEPSGDASATRRATPVEEVRIEEAISEFLLANPDTPTIHEITVRRSDGELAVSFHCTLDPETAITDAHLLTERIESHLRKRIANLGRVVIHVEPPQAE